MKRIALSDKDADNAALEKRLWDAAQRANLENANVLTFRTS